MPQQGIHSFTVPGAVDGWWKMHQRYGKLPWKDLFQSAIAYAEHGFPVSEAIQESWADPANRPRIKANPESVRVFLPGGKAPLEGDLFRNPGMARALRLVAEKGPDAFYKGEIAAAILKTSQQPGRHHDRRRPGLVFRPNGCSRSPSITAAGASTNCRPTARAWPRSKC